MSTERTRIVIVGSGFAGLCLAIKLHEAGIRDFVVLEKAEALGGTWRDNRYPGCACDVPSYLYSYSFAPSREWSRMYAGSDEIRAYLERVATERDVRGYLRFGAELTRASRADGRWTVETVDGRRWSSEVLVLATGGLSRPQLPRLEGVGTFAGPAFHTAGWRHDVPLEGRRVGVIGTGASAIQLVPHVAERAAHLSVFQRTPPWIVPKRDVVFTPGQRKLLSAVPPAAWLLRGWIYCSHEARALVFTGGERVRRIAQRVALRHLHAQVSAPELRAKLTPDYSIGCKRILISNDYYPALQRPNVELLTTRIERIVPEGVVTSDGVLRPFDVLIYGTGFAVQDYLGKVDITGGDGVSLRETWKNGAEAYLGTTVSGFPNLFLLGGPNTGLGHNSVIYMTESQVQYVMSALAHMDARKLAAVEVRPEAQARYNAKLAERLGHTVWSSGCESWYQNDQRRNTTLWPGFTFEFRARTQRFDPDSYREVPA